MHDGQHDDELDRDEGALGAEPGDALDAGRGASALVDPVALFSQAAERDARGDARGALRVLFDLFRAEPAHREGLALASDLAARLHADREAALFHQLALDPLDPQALYDAGYLFVEQGRPAVGAAFLARCRTRLPAHPQVAYELGYALVAAGDWRGAIPLLEEVVRSELHGPEPFAAGVLLVQSHVFARQLDAARAAFDALDARDAALGDPDAEAQVDALAQLLARADRFARRGSFGPREWQFVAHGGILLHVARSGKDALPAATAGLDFLAGLLRRLESVLAGLDLLPGRVLWLGEPARPLARAFAERVGAEAAAYAPGAERQTLVMMKDPDAAAAHRDALRQREDGVELFALSLDPRRSYPIAPEIVGQFATRLLLPWEARMEFAGSSPADAALTRIAADAREPDRIAAELSSAMAAMEGDEGDKKALNRYYAPLKDLLVAGNYGPHPARRVFTPRAGAIDGAG